MPKRYSKLLCVIAVIALFILPLVGRVFIAGKGLPPDFLSMPIPKGPEKPGFHLWVFLAILIPCIVVTLFVFFPQWFGFKRTEAKEQERSTAVLPRAFPAWFWVGIALWLGFLSLMWGQFAFAGRLVYFTFVPMSWGAILALDGLVYYRTGGKSLIAERPWTMVGIAFASWTGWFVFQYLNYFMLNNWYYPDDGLLSPLGYRLWHQIGNTTVWPGVLECYYLLYTFKGLRTRFIQGPKLDLKPFGMHFVIVGIIMTLAISIWPIPMFWSVWLGPTFIVGGVLLVCRLWLPVTPIERGDWSCFVLLALGCLLYGMGWELFNTFSAPLNPSFWAYDVPYFQWMPKFGQMPILGLSGYIPFGVHCMFWWLASAHIFGWSRYIIPELEDARG